MIILFIIYIHAVSACFGGPVSNEDQDETHVLIWIGHMSIDLLKLDICPLLFSIFCYFSIKHKSCIQANTRKLTFYKIQSHHAFLDPLANNSKFQTEIRG